MIGPSCTIIQRWALIGISPNIVHMWPSLLLTHQLYYYSLGVVEVNVSLPIEIVIYMTEMRHFIVIYTDLLSLFL